MPQDQYELTIKTFREYARMEIDNHLSELNTSYQDRALDSGDLKHEGFKQHHKILENELKEKIQEEKASLTKMNIGHQISPVENPMTIRTARKLVARLSTELTKKSNASK